MHSEKNDTTQRPGQLSADRGKPAGRIVRALLGLPESATGSVQGQGQVPPVTFRYLMVAEAGEPSHHRPLSGRTPGRPALDVEKAGDRPDREDEGPQVMAPDHSPMVDRPSTGNGQRIAVVSHPRRDGEEVPRHDRPQPRARVMTAMTPAVPAASGTEKPRQTARDSGQAGERALAAAGQKEATSGNKQEMAIPGRSTARQLFPSLAQAQSDHPASADQPPAMPQPSLPLRVGPIGQKGNPATQANRSEHLSQAEEHAQPPVNRQEKDRTATPEASPHEPLSATALRSTRRPATAGKSAARDSEAGNIAAAPERQPAVATQPQREQTQGEVRAGQRQPAVAPARRPDEEGVRRIEELRRTFYDLISKKTTATETVDHGQTSPAERETPPPPLQQIVVINRTSGSRNGGRLPAAFWERSYMARTTLKMIR